LKFTNIEPTVALESYASDKFESLSRVLSRFDSEGAADLHLELAHTTRHHQKGNVYMAKANLRIPGRTFQVSEEANDLYAAIDIAKDTLLRSLEKYKDLVSENR
jgi:ribosomal subunit interface protein